MVLQRLKNALSGYTDLAANHGHALALKVYVLKRLRWKGPTAVTIHGQRVFIRPFTHDLTVAKSCLGEEFEPLRGILPADFAGLIVDAGGYIGTAAVKLTTLYPRATIVTIEPSDENYAVLLKNIAQHPKIVAVKAALATSGGGQVNLSTRGTGAWGYTVVEGFIGETDTSVLQSVDTVSLEELSKRFGGGDIGIVKMDIEGAEKDILSKADRYLKDARALFIELHDKVTPGCSAAFATFSKGRVVQTFGGEKYLVLRDQAAA